jgi:hypothetical protein
MSERYVLNAKGKPVPEPDLIKWAEWFEEGANRQLAEDKVRDGVTVSTVFLGLNHNFGNGVPLLWETMIFGGPEDQYQERYATREEALAGHIKAVALASSA